jgi:hypothetical protein
VRQARQQASDHRGLAVWVTPRRARTRGKEDPDGGPCRHPSSSQGVDSRHQLRRGQRSTFAQASQSVAAAATLWDTLPPPSADGVNRLYHQLGEILAITTAQQAECTHWCRADKGSTLSLARSMAYWRRPPWTPLWQEQLPHQLGFHPRAHHGSRVCVRNPRNTIRLTRGLCDRTTSEMRGSAPKIISGDSR